jgi:erythromycin esterase-like protein
MPVSVAASESFYRAMYEGSAASWNLRDTHMFETLKAIFEARGPETKAVVWAHNSHIGDARATQMGQSGEINIGQLCRSEYGEAAVLIGFGTDRGTVTAASEWGGSPETKEVRPAVPDSWGALMREVSHDTFFLDLRNAGPALAEALEGQRPERFIGVLYLPETERISHYAKGRAPPPVRRVCLARGDALRRTARGSGDQEAAQGASVLNVGAPSRPSRSGRVPRGVRP